MKRLLTIPYCLLLLCLLMMAVASARAVVPGMQDTLLSPAAPAAHVAGLEEGSAPTIITVGFGILAIYALYRYWSDSPGQKSQ